MQLFMSIILSINTSGLKAQFVYLKKKKKVKYACVYIPGCKRENIAVKLGLKLPDRGHRKKTPLREVTFTRN